MKSTKIMLAFIACFLTTWLCIATFAYLLSSVTDFKTCVTNGGTMMFMLIIGWLPAVIVCCDLHDKFYNE